MAIDVRAPTRLGEVIAAQTAEFTAQSYLLEGAPPFGALVRASDGRVDIYGFVCGVSTGSIDAGRRVAARGAGEPNEASLFENNPELGILLRTEFRVAAAGFREDGRVRHRLPPHPPRLHGFVHTCDALERRAFGDRLDYLQTLVAATTAGPADELIGAAIQQLAAASDDPHAYLAAAGKRLASLLGGDLRRLSAILWAARA